MASFSFSMFVFLVVVGTVSGQLSPLYYNSSCNAALTTINNIVTSAVANESRMGASLLRLHFHDCFVNGCDGSILLDDNSTTNFTGEKTAIPNVNSVRGYDVIDQIKSSLEAICPGVVSCADIVAVAARDAVVALGGPTWTVPLGRNDSTTANFTAASTELPSPFLDLSDLIAAFSNKGFTTQELVTFSGAHTIGMARCITFRNRIYNETNIDSQYRASLQLVCPSSGGDSNLTAFENTTATFDNAYFQNLVEFKGLLHSDQQLFNNASTDSQVQNYSVNSQAFFSDFGDVMVKLGNLGPPAGISQEVRTSCRKINGS